MCNQISSLGSAVSIEQSSMEKGTQLLKRLSEVHQDIMASEADDLAASLSRMIFNVAVLLLSILTFPTNSDFSCLLFAYLSCKVAALDLPALVGILIDVDTEPTRNKGQTKY